MATGTAGCAVTGTPSPNWNSGIQPAPEGTDTSNHYFLLDYFFDRTDGSWKEFVQCNYVKVRPEKAPSGPESDVFLTTHHCPEVLDLGKTVPKYLLKNPSEMVIVDAQEARYSKGEIPATEPGFHQDEVLKPSMEDLGVLSVPDTGEEHNEGATPLPIDALEWNPTEIDGVMQYPVKAQGFSNSPDGPKFYAFDCSVFKIPQSDHVLISDCPVQQGLSGSGIYAEDREGNSGLIGLSAAFTEPRLLEEDYMTLKALIRGQGLSEVFSYMQTMQDISELPGFKTTREGVVTNVLTLKQLGGKLGM